jgi:hypothetical protein
VSLSRHGAEGKAPIDSLVTDAAPLLADKTVTAVTDNSNATQQNAAAAALAPSLQGITAALTAATKTLTKPEVLLTRSEAHGPTVLELVVALVWEIACTLKFVIIKLGLGQSFALPRWSVGSAANEYSLLL